eukprot:4230542-Pleurochrysis_carterae.AAC.5
MVCARGVDRQTASARALRCGCVRQVATSRHTPLVQAACTPKRENEARAERRGRRENSFYISEAHGTSGVVRCGERHVPDGSACLGAAVDTRDAFVACAYVY